MLLTATVLSVSHPVNAARPSVQKICVNMESGLKRVLPRAGIQKCESSEKPLRHSRNNTFKRLSICGSNRKSLCVVGAQGPGGGFVFFVDSKDQYAGFDYLEAAPVSCEASRAWSFDITHILPAAVRVAADTFGRGQFVTTAMVTGSGSYVADTSGAGFYADGLVCGGESDWFLGTVDEMKVLNANLQGAGGLSYAYYWSSSQFGGWGDGATAFRADRFGGLEHDRILVLLVRPIRSF